MFTLKTRFRYAFPVLFFSIALAGCDSTATEPEITPELTKVYDLDLQTRYIEVRGSCDKDLLGNSSPGEFQYRIVVSGAGQTHTQESRGYNTVTGENYQRNASTTINFANKTYTWRGLPRDATIDVKLNGAEWDGVSKDTRMANRGGSKAVPFALSKETRSVTIGATAACQIRLYYDALWLERIVEG
jgi:hypothetical protein